MIALSDLAELNEVDLRLDVFKKQIAAIETDIGEQPALPALQDEIKAQEVLGHELGEERKSVEDDVATRQTKITKEEGTLYGGSITDAKELRNLQEAIYALRRGLKEVEDLLITQLEREEAEQAAAAYLDQLRKASREAWQARQSGLEERRGTLAEQAAAIQSEVDEWRGLIDDDDLAVYDSHRVLRPTTIAAIVSGVCGSCHLTLPTTVMTRARRADEAVLCPSCSCIVYVP